MHRYGWLLAIAMGCGEPECPETSIDLDGICAHPDPSCPEGYLLGDTCVDASGEPIVEPPPEFEGDAEAFVDLFYQVLCSQHASCLEERHEDGMICLPDDTSARVPAGCTMDLERAKTCIAELYAAPCGYPKLLWPPTCRSVWTDCPDPPLGDADDALDVVFRERGTEPDGRWYSEISADLALEVPRDRDRVTLTMFAGNTYHLQTTLPDTTGDRANTVVQFYGPDGALIREIDDQPLRAGGPATAFMHTATESGPYTLQVLEYSDWPNAEEDLTPYGDPSFTYGIHGTRMKNGEWTPNETIDDVRPATTDDSWAVPYARWWTQSGFSDIHGELSSPEDVDIWPLRILSAVDVVEQAFTIWPDEGSTAAVELSVLDEQGNVLATSQEVGTGRIGWRLDESIALRMQNNAVLFLRVRSAEGATGAGAYTIRTVARLPSEPEVEPNETTATATPLQLDALENVKAWGRLESGDVDVFELVTPNLTGRDLTLYTRAQGLGTGVTLDVTVTNGIDTVLSRLQPGIQIEGDPGASFVFLRQSGLLYVTVKTNEEITGSGEYFFVATVHD